MSNTENNTPKEQLTDVAKDKLNGPVRQIKKMQYKAFEKYGKTYLGKPEGESYERKNSLTTYNEKGYKIKEIDFSTNGESRYEHNYNEKGLLTESYNYNNDGSLAWKSVTTYNDNNKEIENIVINGEGKVIGSHTNEYNEKGKLIEKLDYDYTGKLRSKSTWIYDEKGNQVETKQTDAEGIATFWRKSKYNPKGHCIEVVDLNPDGSIKQTLSFANSYDNEGNPIPRNTKNPYMPFEYISKVESDHHDNWIRKINYYRNKPVNIYIREISYYGEEPKEAFTTADTLFEVPVNTNALTTEEMDESTIIDIKVDKERERDTPLTPDEAKWLAERTSTPELFPCLAYYMLKNNRYPSEDLYTGQLIDAFALLEELKSNINAQVIFSYYNTYPGYENKLQRYVLTFPENDGYMIYASQIQQLDAEEYNVPDFINNHNNNRQMFSVYTSPIYLFYPSEASGKRDEYGIEDEIKSCIDKCTLEKKPEKPYIYMVEVSDGKFYLQSHAANDDFEINDLDVHYGYGFEKFHNDLMNRFKNENKGLVLFHGVPGTGKTYYIRHLLRQMATSNKVVIYMPPNMVDYLVEPGFMTFLAKTVSDYSADGYFCVLLIEDAEPLLAARHTETRIQGVTNLLNMTDGLLNDMLKLQIICTFNVELKQLDEALLRPGRLIARKEFKPLQELDANLLAQRLGIKHHFTAPATLSEIYALLKNKNIIIHDEY